ncbi:heavy-metal-associated domain-containing protein [Paenibacillus hemerocallicola]|jgi:copper chaperone|uniref:Heavy-metal-associated domain-containing protein n=1 Tax=Paenibacillus hemerocallicola TaxID=1172614 RepID=A0A5C4TBJ3_9BACL|nr:copper ion binding protein [Paenibacillus hemerocallicola]TNJ66281.1 heavy-metal-associated domain-containing protein [Paenibacillus hemerocallicola]
MQNVNLKVDGMSCGHCVNSIEGAVKKLGASAKVDLDSKSVSLQFDESKVTLEAIKTAIEDQGYDVV